MLEMLVAAIGCQGKQQNQKCVYYKLHGYPPWFCFLYPEINMKSILEYRNVTRFYWDIFYFHVMIFVLESLKLFRVSVI